MSETQEMERVLMYGGGGMMKRGCSLTFEEPVENVGTTSKEHHEIYNTLQLLWLKNLVPPGVLFFSWLFFARAHL